MTYFSTSRRSFWIAALALLGVLLAVPGARANLQDDEAKEAAILAAIAAAQQRQRQQQPVTPAPQPGGGDQCITLLDIHSTCATSPPPR